MNAHFEILPFSAEWQDLRALPAETDEGEQAEQGERAARLPRGGMGRTRQYPRNATGAGPGSGQRGGTFPAPGARKGQKNGPREGPRKGAGKGARKGRWPDGWYGPPVGYWPLATAVYEPDWLALADAPPRAEPPAPPDDSGDSSDVDGNDAAEWIWR